MVSPSESLASSWISAWLVRPSFIDCWRKRTVRSQSSSPVNFSSKPELMKHLAGDPSGGFDRIVADVARALECFAFRPVADADRHFGHYQGLTAGVTLGQALF